MSSFAVTVSKFAGRPAVSAPRPAAVPAAVPDAKRLSSASRFATGGRGRTAEPATAKSQPVLLGVWAVRSPVGDGAADIPRVDSAEPFSGHAFSPFLAQRLAQDAHRDPAVTALLRRNANAAYQSAGNRNIRLLPAGAPLDLHI